METFPLIIKSKRNPRNMFTQSEDKQLIELVSKYGSNDWKTIAQFIKGREARQCRDRYLKYLAPNVVNGPWTPEEEDLLTEKFNIYGSSWKTIATFFPTRTDVNIKSKWKKMQRHITKELLSNSNNYSNESVFSSSDSENSPIISQATTPKEQEEYVINMVNEEDPYIFDGLWTTIMDDESFFEYEM